MRGSRASESMRGSSLKPHISNAFAT
jgi:hypothetical protein